MGGALHRVPQRLANLRDRRTGFAGCGSPAVTCRMECQGVRQMQTIGKPVQQPVIIIERHPILSVSLFRVVAMEYREHIGRHLRIIASYEFCNQRLYAHHKRPAGFTACVVDEAVPHICAAQESHIYKRHAARAEAKQIQVSDEREGARAAQIRLEQQFHNAGRNGAFPRALHSRVDPAERGRGRNQPALNRLVESCAEYAYIKRHRIAR